VVCIVLDGVGIGAAPDADDYGDAGSNSIANTARVVGGMRLPNLGRLGLGRVATIDGVPAGAHAAGAFGAMQPASAGKDSTTGHWELMGLRLAVPFPTYADGFPVAVVSAIEDALGCRVLGNVAASGTDIIQQLGDAHVRSGCPILYTSQDSVFQLAAHDAVWSNEELYAACATARQLLREPHAVARVIARPFSGESGAYYRTPGRRDFSVVPPGDTLLDKLERAGLRVTAIGKIAELFCGRGIATSVKTADNREGMAATLAAIADANSDFVFTNLVDFDTMWGHRNDARAYALGLEEFDSFVPALLDVLDDHTTVIVTSDHGHDPTTPSTDHSRENVPLLVFGPRTAAVDLGRRLTLSDVAATVAEWFGVDGDFSATSFAREVMVSA